MQDYNSTQSDNKSKSKLEIPIWFSSKSSKHFRRKCNMQAQTNATIPTSSMVTGTFILKHFAVKLCNESKTVVEQSVPTFALGQKQKI